MKWSPITDADTFHPGEVVIIWNGSIEKTIYTAGDRFRATQLTDHVAPLQHHKRSEFTHWMRITPPAE